MRPLRKIHSARRGVLALVVLLLMPGVPALARHHEAPTRRADEFGTAQVRFAEFETAVMVQADGFEQSGRFTLGEESSGADPLTQDVGLSVGTFAVTLPAGAFRRLLPRGDGQVRFTFEGTIAGTWLEVVLAQIDDKRFELKVEGRSDAAMEIVRPEFVTLTIGENAGSLVSAKVDEGV